MDTDEPNRFVVRELDLAAGEGRNAVWLAERGWRMTAMDFPTVAVGRGRWFGAATGVDVGWAVVAVRSHPLPKGDGLGPGRARTYRRRPRWA